MHSDNRLKYFNPYVVLPKSAAMGSSEVAKAFICIFLERLAFDALYPVVNPDVIP